MAIEAKILKDSRAPCGARLITWELTYPRFIHSELMTHRQFSRNAASSRAIPTRKMLAYIKESPAMPVWWGKNQRGMQAKEEIDEDSKQVAKRIWLEARDAALEHLQKLRDLNLHKQVANRIIEPWKEITVIVSSTFHKNFFKLRAHPDAQPEFQDLAYKMKHLYETCSPEDLAEGEWHLPLVFEEDREQFDVGDLIKISTGRCARVSYLTHDGKRDPQKDIELHDRLVSKSEGEPLHASPAEHIAQASSDWVKSGNFVGFIQYRKTLPFESEAEYPEMGF